MSEQKTYHLGGPVEVTVRRDEVVMCFSCHGAARAEDWVRGAHVCDPVRRAQVLVGRAWAQRDAAE